MKNSEFEHELDKTLSTIRKLLIEKNESYGDSAINPIRVFSKASADEQLKVRLDDKLSRLARGKPYPNDNDIIDIIGYLILLQMVSNKHDAGDNYGQAQYEDTIYTKSKPLVVDHNLDVWENKPTYNIPYNNI